MAGRWAKFYFKRELTGDVTVRASQLYNLEASCDHRGGGSADWELVLGNSSYDGITVGDSRELALNWSLWIKWRRELEEELMSISRATSRKQALSATAEAQQAPRCQTQTNTFVLKRYSNLLASLNTFNQSGSAFAPLGSVSCRNAMHNDSSHQRHFLVITLPSSSIKEETECCGEWNSLGTYFLLSSDSEWDLFSR